MGTGIHVLPQSYWYELLYGTVLLALCLIVCLVGASIYAKATFLIFLIVAGVLGTILVSFFATRPLRVPIHLPYLNGSKTENGNFTGFSLATLQDNLGGEERLYPPACWTHYDTGISTSAGARWRVGGACGHKVGFPMVCVWGH